MNQSNGRVTQEINTNSEDELLDKIYGDSSLLPMWNAYNAIHPTDEEENSFVSVVARAQHMINKKADRQLKHINQLSDYCSAVFNINPDLFTYEFEIPSVTDAEVFDDGPFLCVVLTVKGNKYAGMSKCALIDTYDFDRGLDIALHRAIEKFFSPETL